MLSLLSNPSVFHWQQKLCNTYDNVREEFIELLRKDGQSILDIGCSTGTAASQIVDFTKNKYVGIDIAARYVRYATKKFPTGTFKTMDARKMEFDAGTFDIAMFIGVLHHMNDETIIDCFREVRRVLKPNGKVIVAEPVFTPNELMSNILLSLDRGEYIRESGEYISLCNDFSIERTNYFRFSAHRFFSIVMKPAD